MKTITNSQGILARIEVCDTAQRFYNVRIDTEPPVRLQIAHADTINTNVSGKTEPDALEALLMSNLARYGFTKGDLKR
jgi:hypothetical protein